MFRLVLDLALNNPISQVIHSHSTGRRTARTGQPSDPDAAWGCHSHFSTDHTGREQKNTKRWFGYKTHWLADVRYEIPINWTTRPANESEHRHSKALVEQYLNRPAGARCQTFVADRGLDDNPLRRMIHRSGGTAVIETRRMWQDSALPGEVHPTRALNADVIDHLIYDERGIVSCRASTDRPNSPDGLSRCRKGTSNPQVPRSSRSLRVRMSRP